MEGEKRMALYQLKEIEEEDCPDSEDHKHKIIAKSFPGKPKKGEDPQYYEYYCLVCGKTFEVPCEQSNKP